MRGVLTHGPVGLVCLAMAWCMGCAASGTIAWGKDARAALFAPPAASCEAQRPAQVVGEKRTVTEKLDDKIGFKPQVEERTVTTEPALAPVAEQPLAQESRGAAISAGGKSLLGSLFGALKAIGCIGSVGVFCGP